MQNQESFSFLDLIQNRISNPAILTFTWVLIICNWQAVGWFLFEPLKFSLKLKEFSNTGIEVFFWKALGITALVLIFGRLLSNIVDLIRYLWDQGFALVMKTLNLKQYVDMNSYHKAIDEMNQLKDENRVKQAEKDTLISDLSSFKTQTEELKKQLDDHDKAFATELARSEELREKISTLEQTIKNKEASLNELSEELEALGISNQKMQKSLNRANESIEENQNEFNKLYKTIDNLETLIDEKDTDISDLESNLVRVEDENTEFETLVKKLKQEINILSKGQQTNKPEALIPPPPHINNLDYLNSSFANPNLDKTIAYIANTPPLEESYIDLKVGEDNHIMMPEISSTLPDRYKHLDATAERVHREAVASKKEEKK